MNPQANQSEVAASARPPGSALAQDYVYWRVEGSLLGMSATRAVAFFTWNAHTFLERWLRRGGLTIVTLLRPILFLIHPNFATRVLNSLLRGVSRDRLDALGDEYFHYVVRPRLKSAGAEKLKEVVAAGENVVLVSQALDHVMRPLALHFGVRHLLANRLDFRDGMATGRLLAPVLRPRGAFAWLGSDPADGRVAAAKLARDLGISADTLRAAVTPAAKPRAASAAPVVVFDRGADTRPLSVRAALRGRNILLVGVTGFIGKVWLVNTLLDVPDVGKIYLLIRRHRSNPAQRRFEKIVQELPLFDPLEARHGARFADFLREKVEVIEGDVSQPGFGVEPDTLVRLRRELDLVVNSSGLTDFNPDLRDAVAANVDAVVNTLDFVRACDHAALLHLSTCYVVGMRDGRIPEVLTPDYTPRGTKDFDAEREWRRIHEHIREIEARAEGPEITAELKQQALAQEHRAKDLSGAALDNQIRKNRVRWLKNYFTDYGTQRAQEFGWPNTYTLTKSLAESLIAKYGGGLPIAVVRPSIVETSTEKPFSGWNEGINTSAGLSYLLGTYFRQLPSNRKKCLDVIPVDLVCRGMTLIAAALIERRHHAVYQLATSVDSPCDMRRAIEVTGLAHRKFYRQQNGFEHQVKLRFDPIPVSKARFEKMSAPAQKAVVRVLRQLMPTSQLKQPLVRTERLLNKVEKLIELYEPFILHNDHTFEARNVALLSALLPEDEKRDFGYDGTGIDWGEYWIDIHIPALRKWSYPLIEGRSIEYEKRRAFTLSPAPASTVET